MNGMSIMRAFGSLIVSAGGALVCAGCGYTVTATDGTIYKQSTSLPDALPSALLASAARDLPCASGDVEVKRIESEREYAVSGCGLRVVYRVDTPTVASRRIELVSRSAVAKAKANPPY